MAKEPAGLIGRQFGQLEVIGPAVPYVHPSKYRSARRWGCRCVCGNISVVREDALLCAHTLSCGCLSKGRLVEFNTSHGHASGGLVSREYNAWAGAKSRCYNENNPQYADYGGRGLRMADEWINDFSAFLGHIGLAPSGTTLDRKNNNGNYEPGNVKWSTPTEQSRNRRSNRLIEAVGQVKTLAEWSSISGIKSATIAVRLANGVAPKDAIFTKPGALP